MNEKTRLVRELAVPVAPLLPGEWRATWDEITTGAYLTSGNMKIFLSGQEGYASKRGMIRISPQVPQEYRDVGVDAENAVNDIYVSIESDAARIAREITRRILVAQDYEARADRQTARIDAYRAAEANAEALAENLAGILGEKASGTKINAWPHGTWDAGNGTAHLSIYLPAELAVKVAKLIMTEYEKHGRSYP